MIARMLRALFEGAWRSSHRRDAEDRAENQAAIRRAREVIERWAAVEAVAQEAAAIGRQRPLPSSAKEQSA